MAPGHNAKRQYAGTSSHAQQAITSYFQAAAGPSCATTNPSLYSPNSSHSPLSPPLPHKVQADLLAVGMRVRKSVPEGYKTGSSASAFKLFTDTTTTKSTVMDNGHLPNTASGASDRPGHLTQYTKQELTPFCGINKVGGLGVQDWGVPDEDDIPFLSSQGSTATNASFDDEIPGYGKRSFDDEEQDGEMDDVVMSRLDVDARIIAMPRTRRKQTSKTAYGLGQENASLEVDFEEAAFLDPSICLMDL